MLYGFCLDKGTHYWRAITLRKPAVRAVGQAPSGWETRGERVSVVKFPFRHLSLAGFVTREFCVFSHFHLPPGDDGALLASHSWKDSRDASGLDSLVCNSLSAGLGWAGLCCGWLALGALI